MSANPSPPARSAAAGTPRLDNPGPGSANSLRVRGRVGQEERERERTVEGGRGTKLKVGASLIK